MKKLTLGSLFDGSGGFPLAGLICGIEPIWSSEILPYATRVTTKRLPQVKHYGDISKLNGGDLEAVDIITFGSPCQSVSIAGRRDGIKHTARGDDVTTRSGLFFEAIRIIKEMRSATNNEYPRYIVFENVGGIYSSTGGEDFRTVLEEICSIKEADVHIPRPAKKWHYAGEIVGDGYSVAWRTLDAQYFNVPQRRARCFLVGDFGGTSAAKVLFESEGLSGYSSESCGSREETAAAVEKGNGTASGENESTIDAYDNMTATFRSQARHPSIIMESAGFCTEHSAKSRSIGYEKEVSPTLRAGTVPAAVFENHSADTRYTGPLEVSPTVSATYGTGGNNQPFVVESKAFAICSKESNAMKSDNPDSGFYETDTARTIDTSNQSPVKNQGGIAIVENIKNYDVKITSEGTKNARQNVYETETSRTIDTGKNSPDSNQGGVAVVALQGSMIGRKDENGLVESDYKDPPVINDNNGVKYIVRRLTPKECAKLMGFSPNWCSNLETENPTAEDIVYWREIFNEYNRAIGKNTKPKSDNQIIKWLKNPHSDSAEYAMWGNGVVLTCVCFVLSGIVYYNDYTETESTNTAEP